MNAWIERLEYRNTPGVGKQIYARFSDGVEREVLNRHPIGYEPWRQFKFLTPGLDEKIDELFTEMVTLWNEQNANER